ncbi:MAG: MXAN_5187 C-terminal domain-containing protein [Polyangiales bacterium]
MTPDEINKELEELEGRLERLRVKYEQYFTGIEKAVPWVQRKDVDRRFQMMHREQLRSSGQRFRFNSLVQRFTTYQTYWGRILRRIEEGTLKRDVLRAQRLGTSVPKKKTDLSRLEALADAAAAAEGEESTRHAGRGEAEEMPEDMFGDGDGAARGPADGFVDFGFSAPPPPMTPEAPVKPARPAIPMPSSASQAEAARRPMISAFAGLRGGAVPRPAVGPLAGAGDRPSAPPPPRPAPQEDGAVRALYDRFIAARQTTGETSEVRFEQVAKQVKETLPKLAEKYQGADVTFDVAIKDGKAILRPVVTVKKR